MYRAIFHCVACGRGWASGPVDQLTDAAEAAYENGCPWCGRYDMIYLIKHERIEESHAVSQ